MKKYETNATLSGHFLRQTKITLENIKNGTSLKQNLKTL